MRIAITLAAAAIALSACGMPDQDSDQGADGSPQAAPTTETTTSAPATAQTTEKPRSTPSAGTKQVRIVDFVFEPGDITVPVGTTVVWQQLDDSTHTVDFDDGEKSGDMAKGDTYRHTFDTPGKYPYLCFYHPRMTGTVTVTG
ncbi:MAG: amidase [Actinophytocola sp.]|nr:amidase [Actinophytocola sp.]